MEKSEVLSNAYRQMVELSQLIEHIFKGATKDMELTKTQFLMMKLIQTKGSITIGQIAKYCEMDQGNTSSVCKKLEKRGWVIRNRNPEDERVVLVSLSADGELCLKAIERYAYEVAQGAIVLMEEAEIQNLITSLDRLILCLKESVGEGGIHNAKV